jgi:hypothetical protein
MLRQSPMNVLDELANALAPTHGRAPQWLDLQHVRA